MSEDKSTSFIKKYWERVLHVGYRPDMDSTQQMRLFVVNAFLLLSLLMSAVFIAVFVLLGSYSALEGLFVIPVFMLVFLLNARHKYIAARVTVTYGLILMALALALADRRTGTEYIMIAVGCCSVVVYERVVGIIASFLFSFICYLTYIYIDATLPFVPDPTVPYLLVENSLMFLSALAIVAQSFVFRSLINTYSQNLKQANAEIKTVNEELKSSNEELQTFLENMDSLVRKKSAQLKAYIDAIDTSVCAATLDLEGNFTMINKPFAMLSGYAPGELVGMHYSIFDSGQFTAEFLSTRDESLLLGKSWSGELKYKRRDGSHFWIDCVVIPMRDESETVKEFLSLGIPVTERKLTDELKEKTRRMLETVAFKTSHKIRGPLATIEGLTNLLQQRLVSQQEFEMIALKLASSHEDLREATSELVQFVNDHQQTLQGEQDLIK